MKIGDLARETGVSVRLLRYYEEQALLESRRLPSGHRRYEQDAPETVRRIRVLLAAGLPTRVIRDVLPCVRGAGETEFDPCVVLPLREQLQELDARIGELQQTRAALAGLLTATETGAETRAEAVPAAA
ncbi:MerR family transcriptional regulator [Streptomyces sp. URMC 124]|uniref:MerR family transcriptional regulator n=1 Tax=Streptomyces sp. URMC 124 TaxID=3423405 RepID=UPI003F1D1E78